MIDIQGIHHVSLPVTNLEKAKYFYGSILEFPEISRPDFNFPGAWYQIGGHQLHLIVNTKSETLRSKYKLETKDGHFAIRINNYKETVNFLNKKNVDFIEKPYSRSGFAQIFCMDPDRNIIEFNVDQKKLNI